ncbi:MCP four helix bundle domain-containing protein [Undibacterium sp. CY18W]|uniref:MCP four helix bundle domain-containing protein n=1 Tax=Undibacterium hunanense TaxID=2762292 RepID=A0ABR6ZTR7_9BURK|nr:methyl-accepting chemotaxis protein [Undibacterium hunanense]MBC3918953.1 MCP four helix bundle domain-containing protein [Undibacterium hunanense]
MKLANLRIGTRLGAGFALVLILLLGVAYLGIHGMNRSNEALHHVVAVNVKKIEVLEDMSKSVHIVSRVIRTIALLSDEARANTEHKKIDDARARYNTALAALEKMPLDEAGKAFITKIKEDQIAARTLNDKFADMAKTNRDEATLFLLKEAGPVNTKWQDAIQEFIDLQEKKNQSDEQAAAAAYQSAFSMMIIITGIAFVAGAGIAWFSTHTITAPIAIAVNVAKTVAKGDLTSDIQVTSTDETGQLMQALKDMNDNLVNIVGKVRSGTDTITTATGEIASGNLDLSSRTEQQAGSLEETASSMEELTSTVKHNAANAREANQLAISASEVAVKGGAVVTEVVNTMGSINASSKKIVDIISVIDGIAFQTNILALNAAVEAARAGEQGRGFAVVASEVRTLAQRSAAAAKEIKTLINDSVEQVDIGSRLVNQAGSTMESVVSSIKNVTDIMGEITLASQEQTSGIEQVNQAVTQMDETTQQNAALVEQAAAAAASLEEQAHILAEVVSVFKMPGSQETSFATPEVHRHKAAVSTARKHVNHNNQTKHLPNNVRSFKQASSSHSDTAGEWNEF